MFIRIILSYIIGYLKISVEGYYIERFINICKTNNIAIWNLKRSDNTKLIVNLNVRKSDFKELCKIAKKVKCRVKIQKKKGIPFLVHKYKKRKIFFGFLLFIIIFLIISSNFVWNIEIKIEENQEIENIEQSLDEAGLKVAKLKAQIDTKDIINKVRLQRDDIAWMGIQMKGTNAIVKIVKSVQKPEIIDENEYCNIVSDKAGIITKINAQNGTANVKVGDTVNIGEILINGWMEGKYTGLQYVHAKGEIEAKVWHTKNKKILYKTTERRKTGEKEELYAIKFNNFKINFNKGVSKFEIYDTIENENRFKLFSDFYLPISVIKITNEQVEEISKTYNYEEAKQLGIKQLQQELDEEIDNKEKIVNKNINVVEEQDGVMVSVTYEVLESIGTNEKNVF